MKSSLFYLLGAGLVGAILWGYVGSKPNEETPQVLLATNGLNGVKKRKTKKRKK